MRDVSSGFGNFAVSPEESESRGRISKGALALLLWLLGVSGCDKDGSRIATGRRSFAVHPIYNVWAEPVWLASCMHCRRDDTMFKVPSAYQINKLLSFARR